MAGSLYHSIVFFKPSRKPVRSIINTVRMAKTNQIEEVMEAARKDSQVLAVMLFGSRARGTGSRLSDIDLCLVLSPKSYSPLQMSRKKLEYTSRFSADIQVFQQLPLYIRQRVLRDGKVLTVGTRMPCTT